MSEPIRVLIVDDEENILWSLSRALGNAGFTVTTAANVPAARSALLESPIDVLVTDLRMPGEDGFELLRWARTTRPQLRMIMTTSYGSSEVRNAALREGALHYLEKPVDIDALISLLRRACERQGFDATLRDLSLFDLLQFLALTGATRTIEVASGDQRGVLTFVGGQLRSARTDDASGEPAFFKIMSWLGGGFREVALASDETNLRLSTQELLMEAARLLDEARRQRDAPATVRPSDAGTQDETTEVSMMTMSPSTDTQRQPDTQNAVEIAPDVFWVGHRNPRTLLQVNVFLRVFRGPQGTVNLLVDPGSPVDLPVISKKVGQVIGDISKINIFSVNHQDPDVVANAVFLQRMNPKALCIASEDTWRLVAHYELDPAKVRLAEKFKDGKMTLQTGHTVAFLPTPFCHFRGALALYDLETRVLFTGDLFGGLSAAQHKALWASEASWDGIKAFHQIYMPARKVLQRAVASIRALDPKPLIIAPQHGDLLRGEMIDYFLDRVAALPVGADLLEELADPQMLAMLKDAANEVLSLAVSLLGESTVAAKLAAPGAKHEILAHAAVSGATITGVHGAAPELLSILERALSRDEPFEIVNQLRMGGIKAALQRNIPVHTGRLEADDDLIVEPEDDLVS